MSIDRAGVVQRAEEFLAAHDPARLDRFAFLRARFEAGLAWVHYPAGLGGLDADPALQAEVDGVFDGTPDNRPGMGIIGLGMAAPTILRFGSDEQKQRWLPPLWTSEEIWCQLFSEPGAGSDLAALATSAVRDGDDWLVNGQKVWTSLAHVARWAILLTRSDPEQPKHRGLTFFVCDMQAPGVEVRPLRQATGDAEFNEVFLTDVRIPDSYRLGEPGQGWAVAQATLMNERVTIGGGTPPRDAMIGDLLRAWREHPERRSPGLHDAVLKLWVEAEAARLGAIRMRQKQAAGQPGPEGSGGKLTFARLNQQISSLELDVLGPDGLRYPGYARERIASVENRPPGWRYLRAKANSIEGGTSEVMRNIIAERVLGLPAETRTDKDAAWKDLPR